MKAWLNFVGYQAVWFASVLGAARGSAGLGVACCTAFVVWQIGVSSRQRADLLLAGTAFAIGTLLEGVLTQFGVIVHPVAPALWPAPLWIVALWSAFALTLNHSLAFLRPFGALWMGALGGPLAYLAGARLGAIALPSPALGALLLAPAWAASAWLLVTLAHRWRAPRAPHARTEVA